MTFEDWRKANENNIPFKPESENEFIDWLERAWQAARPQWQPIETAPRDKTLIDIYSASLGRLCDYHLHFNNSGKPFYSGVNEAGFIVWDATHWKPTPQPPESTND